MISTSAAVPRALPAEDLEHVLRHTQHVWESLRGARIFITGGTGFFGRWLLESLVHADRALGLDVRATVLTRDPARFERSAVHLLAGDTVALHAGDVRTFEFPRERVTHIVHGATAASAALNEQRPTEMLETIVDGTRRTLDYARTREVERFLLISSGAVYGTQPPSLEQVDEGYTGGPDPLDARNAYAEGKRAAELVATLGATEAGFALSVARCFAFVGPWLPLDAHFAIGNFIRDALRGGPIRLSGDGTPYRSYLYPADLAVWLWTMLARAPAGRAYNVGSDQGVALLDVAHMVAALAPVPCAVERARLPDPSRRAARYVPCTRRAQQELGLAERIPLADAIERTMRWHLGESQRARS